MSRLLLESGDALLIESGSALLLEDGSGVPPSPAAGSRLLLESGDTLLLESGDALLLEASDYPLATATVTGITADGGTAGVTFGFDPNSAGTIYYVVGPAIGWRDPSPAEVAAGQLYGGGAADFADSEVAPADLGAWGDRTPIAGLVVDTEYRVAVVYYTGAVYSNVAVSSVWTTGASGGGSSGKSPVGMFAFGQMGNRG